MRWFEQQANKTHVLARDSPDDIFRGSSQEFGDDGKLVNVCVGVEKRSVCRIGFLRTIFAGEQWFPFQHLGEYAPSAPDINRDIVLLPGQHDLRSPIVPCRDISCHLRILNASETEITDLGRFRIELMKVMRSEYLKIAILINENVTGFLR